MANLSIIQTVAKQNGMKMSELAEKTNMTQQALFQIIRNNSTKVSTLENIAEVLGVSPAIFFDGGDSTESATEELLILRAKVQSLELMVKAYEGQIDALKKSNDILSSILDSRKRM